MAFNSIKLSTDDLASAMKYEPKRSMSNARMLGTVMSTVLGLTMCYASIFYVPALFDFNKAMGITTHASIPGDPKRNIFTPYLELLRVNRGYVMAGKGLEAEYAMAAGKRLKLIIRKCEAPPVIEAFSCQNMQQETVLVRGKTHGTRYFTVNDGAFYYFDAVLTNADGTLSDEPYQVVWRRRQT